MKPSCQKNCDSSVFDGGRIDLLAAGAEILTSEFFLFFPTNSISFTGEYGTDFIAEGILPIMLYGCELGTISKTESLMLERVHRKIS